MKLKMYETHFIETKTTVYTVEVFQTVTKTFRYLLWDNANPNEVYLSPTEYLTEDQALRYARGTIQILSEEPLLLEGVKQAGHFFDLYKRGATKRQRSILELLSNADSTAKRLYIKTGVPLPTIYRYLKQFKALRYVTQDEDVYSITDLGREAVTTQPSPV